MIGRIGVASDISQPDVKAGISEKKSETLISTIGEKIRARTEQSVLKKKDGLRRFYRVKLIKKRDVINLNSYRLHQAGVRMEFVAY